jgi:hypothetical protein
MHDLRKPEREAASFRAFLTLRNREKQHAWSRGHSLLRIFPRPSCRVQRPGELLREAPLLGFLFKACGNADGERCALPGILNPASPSSPRFFPALTANLFYIGRILR